MSFVERGLERLGLGHQMVSFHGAHTRSSFLYPWSPSPEGGLGGSRFSPFSPPPFCVPTFLLYSPPWLILAFYLSVKQMLIPASIPSLVISYFPLVAWIEVYTVQTSFPINQLWVLAGAFIEGGTHFPWSNFTLCFPVGPISLISPSRGCLGITSTRTLIFPLKFWSAEDRVASQPFPLALAIDYSFSPRGLLGTGHGPG